MCTFSLQYCVERSCKTQQDLIHGYTAALDPEAYLFPSTKGGHLEVNTVYQMFQKVANLLGRDDIGTHTLRKTFGYH